MGVVWIEHTTLTSSVFLEDIEKNKNNLLESIRTRSYLSYYLTTGRITEFKNNPPPPQSPKSKLFNKLSFKILFQR
ncbi:hypothetical protein M0811_10336 [Anaeramoeba ignava]|uniref:Uncharacterized protein n=1 Tax=Anaeramoeba ignava TaxID=1746090 RepID=A0A9Q0LEN1_ANAIG|nr:hypothetical protein M0811_10336 [Anaeramoeba ignava]